MAIIVNIQPANTVVDGSTEKIWWDREYSQHTTFIPTVVAIMKSVDYAISVTDGELITGWLQDNNIIHGLYQNFRNNTTLIFFKDSDDATLFKLTL